MHGSWDLGESKGAKSVLGRAAGGRAAGDQDVTKNSLSLK